MDETVRVALAVEPGPTPPTTPTGKEMSYQQGNRWLGKAFRFSFKNFRLGGDISLRHFSITEAALLLMMGYLASRGLGVVRQTIFNSLFGTGPEANAYYAAVRVPEVLFDLIAGGALTHAFIPVLLSYEKDHGQREAWRLASLVFNVLLVVLTALVLLGELLAPTFVSKILVPGYSPAEQALVTSLARIMLLQPLILGLGTVATSILNSKRQFLLPTLAIAVYNFGLIGGLLFSLAIPGVGIYGPTFGIVAAALCHVSVMVPGLVRQRVRYSFIWDLKHPGLRETLRLLAPNALAVAIGSTGFIVDTAFLSYMPDSSSLAAVQNAAMLFGLPFALIAQAIGQAALPPMATQAAAGHYVRMRSIVLRLVVGSILLSIVAALLLYLLGKPTIYILFQHGAFKKHSSTVTGTALIGYAIALPGVATAELLVLAFYALKDARTPLLATLFALGVRWGLILLLLRVLTGPHVILTIPLAHAGAGTLEAILLSSLLFLRLRSKVKLDKGMHRLVRRRNYGQRLRKGQSEQNEQSIDE